jgi:hypothetical protein
MLIGFAQKNYKIAYSYDLTLSKFKSGNGAHEISISAEICGSQKKKKFKTINCPTF